MKKIVKTKEITVIKQEAKKFNLQAFFYILNKPIVIFGLTLVLGIIIAFSLGFWYSTVKDKIFAEDTLRDTLTYQGKIVNADGVPPPDGLYNMKFGIYNQDTNGLLLWTETWDGTSQGDAGSKVQVTSGVFTVELNSLCGNWVGTCASNGGVTFSTNSFYLQVELDFDGDNNYEEIFLPRKRFTATPFSMNADKLDGRDSIDFLLKSGGANGIMTGSLTTPQIIDSSTVANIQFSTSSEIGGFSVVPDSGPNNLPAKLFYTGTANKYLDLNGTETYAQIDDADALSWGNGTIDAPLTISAWINASDMTNFSIAAKGIYNTSAEYKFATDENDKLSFQLFDESADSTYIGRLYNANSLQSYEGTWIHVAATYDGSGTSAGIKIYVNGIEVDDADKQNGTYTAMENLGADLFIGRYDTVYAKGQLDDFIIYSRVLGADEIVAISSAGENRQLINTDQVSTFSLRLNAVDAGVIRTANLYYDPLSQRIITDQKFYAPNNMPYLDNGGNDRDYTHFADDNKILAYDFADSSQGSAVDLLGVNNGNLGDNAGFTNTGLIGYGMSFDHDGDFVSFSAPAEFSISQGTLEMWARLNNISSSETDYLAYFSDGSTPSLELVKQGTGDLWAKAGSDATLVDTGYDFTDTSWHHLALTWSANNYKVFVDGASIYTASYSMFASPSTLLLGYGNSANNSLNGDLDSVALYDDVLSDEEILNHAKNSFGILYINDKLTDGLTETTLGNLMTLPETLNKQNVYDPVYFQYTGNKKLSLAFSEGFGLTTYSNDNNDIYATINGASWDKGFFGQGLSFDGVNDYLEIADTPYDDRLDMGTNDFAIEFWINGSELGNNGKKVISKRNGNTGYEIYYDSGSDSLRFFIGDGTNTVDSPATGSHFSDGKWHHFMVSFDFGGMASIFRDGSLWDMSYVDISSVTGSVTSDANLLIGKDSAGNYFNGKIDSIVFYDLSNDPQFTIYDAFARANKSPDFLFVMGKNTPAGIGTLSVMNESNNGDGAVIGMRNGNNTSGYPLALWNDNVSSDIYNLIYFGTSTLGGGGNSVEYGNLKWDNANKRFIFSNGLHQAGSGETNIFEGMTAIGSTTTPTEMLQVTGNITATGSISGNFRPAGYAPGATCTIGDFTWDSDYVYVCVATDTWKKAALAP